MPWSLKRHYGTGTLHFITTSCYERAPLLDTKCRRDLLVRVLEQMRNRYRFVVVGYVVMPEHLHLLISEPLVGTPSSVVHAIKLGFTNRISRSLQESPHFRQNQPEVGHPDRRSFENHYWMKRFYDFNVWSHRKEAEKLHYMHRNPVVRGLVEHPEDWEWSSFRDYATGQAGIVKVNDWSWWEEKIRSTLLRA